MKNCKWAQRRLIDYIEKTMDEKTTLQCEEHLKACPICKKEYDRILLLYGILDKQKVPFPDPVFWDTVKEHVYHQPVVLKPGSWIRKVVPIAVPVCAIAVILFILLHRPNETVEITVPVSELLEDRDIAAIALNNIISDELIQEFTLIEESLPFDIDEFVGEMTVEEQQLFINLLEEIYNVGT